jgi:hypothetical protein
MQKTVSHLTPVPGRTESIRGHHGYFSILYLRKKMKIKLAEALLRRKELAEKLNVLRHFKDNQLFYEIRGQRVKIMEGLEDVNANYPKLSASQVTAEYDYVAKQLRLVDALIQQTNWTSELEVDPMVMEAYKAA